MPINTLFRYTTMKIIDLTVKIDEKLPVYPGDPKPELKKISTTESHGWNSEKLVMSSHAGTHMDAPFHMIEKGKKLDEFPVDHFCGEGIVLDINNDLSKIRENDIVLFCTGNAEAAFLDKSTVLKLIEKKVKIVGIDSPSPDAPPFDIHKMLFQNNILIVENLTNLEKLKGKRCTFFILPLKINASGAPCRAIAVLE